MTKCFGVGQNVFTSMDGVDSSAASKNVFHVSVDFDPYFSVKLLTFVAINTNADLTKCERKWFKNLEHILSKEM